MKKKILIEIPEQFVVQEDSRGAKFINVPFFFEDGTQGLIVILKKTKGNWTPEIKQITLEYGK